MAEIIFIEVHSKVDPTDILAVPETLVAYDVTGLTIAGREVVVADLKLLYPDATFQYHTCFHDEIPIKGCQIEVI